VHRVAAVLIAIGRRRERLAVAEDEIGLAERPAAAEVERLREIGGIAFRRAVIDPRRDRRNVFGGQRARRIEFAAASTGFHGGMMRADVLALISKACGCASAYVINENGAMSPV
jgi:hypothetical protein